MASAPERHAVLSRLGIIKGGGEDIFAAPLEPRSSFEEKSIDNAFELFPLENASSSLIQQVFKAAVSRTALVVLVVVVAVGVLGALVMFNLGPSKASGAETPTTTPTSTDLSPTVAHPLSSQTATVKKPIRASAPSVAAPASGGRITTNRAEEASQATPRPQQERLDTREPLSSDVTAAVPSSTEEDAKVIDQTLYSKDDADVRPPRLLSEQLPSPTIGGWITRTNVIEIIVSETGAVEHARFMATPQRMPDMLVLSRAKVWKFSPAMKDGRPVRYRLLLSWEVNP